MMQPNGRNGPTKQQMQDAYVAASKLDPELQPSPVPQPQDAQRPPLQFVPRAQHFGPSRSFWIWLAAAMAFTALLAYAIAEGEEESKKARRRRTNLRGYMRGGERRARERDDDDYDDDDDDDDDDDYPAARRNRRVRSTREPVSHRNDGAPAPGAPAIHYHMAPQGASPQGGAGGAS